MNTNEKKCFDYKANINYSKFKTRDNCITRCILGLGNSTACANYYSVLVQESFTTKNASKDSRQKICPHDEQKYSNFLKARSDCEIKCPIECTKTIYEMSETKFKELSIIPCSSWWDLPQERTEKVNPLEPKDENDIVDDFLNHLDTDNQGNNNTLTQTMFNLSQRNSYSPMIKGNNRQLKTASRKQIKSGAYYSSEPLLECRSHLSIRISSKPFIMVRHQAAIKYE